MIENMEYVVNQIYQKIFNTVVEGFDDSEKSLASIEYLNNLKNKYLELGPITEKYFERILMLEYNEWKELSLDVRKHLLLKDNALEEIMNLTGEGYRCAIERLEDNKLMLIENAEKYIKRIEELYPLVKDYNKELAEYYISEGNMDFKYASGQTDCTSLRIGRNR